jgi:hypothetical protein
MLLTPQALIWASVHVHLTVLLRVTGAMTPSCYLASVVVSLPASVVFLIAVDDLIDCCEWLGNSFQPLPGQFKCYKHFL